MGLVLDGELGLVAIVEESVLAPGAELWSDDAGGELRSEALPDVPGFDCMVLSELGGELSGAVPMAC